MSQVVVDTDIASYIFNWHSSAPGYVESLRGSELVLSFMSVAELRMGAIAAGWGSRRRGLLEQFMQGFRIVQSDDAICGIWAKVRAEVRSAGAHVSPQDAWIAATAIELGAPLATNNRKDYVNIPILRLLFP